jgi:hypothetical protein
VQPGGSSQVHYYIYINFISNLFIYLTTYIILQKDSMSVEDHGRSQAHVMSGMAQVPSGMTWVSSRCGSADGPSGHDSKSAEDPSGPDTESAKEALR